MRHLIAIALVLAACDEKKPAPPPPPPPPQQAPLHNAEPSAPVTSTAPSTGPEHADAAEVTGVGSGSAGAACTSVRDCKLAPEDSDCMYACSNGVCQLRGTTRTAGAGPCYGEILAQAVVRQQADTAAPVYLLCDAYADLYCNRTSHTCDAVKKRGAACTTQSECGLDGTCVGGKCAAVPRTGEACEPGVTSCGRDGFCDPQGKRCEPRHDNGQPCDNLGEQCKSAFCGVGDAANNHVCMPAPPQQHCPGVP
ncbi:MAG: hypothetical protein JO257_00610 [Deltaproteobacteria bacterium]|nr:hypothetical protein [Deltaproteobacteria bacterium]